jgi:hypothetical protein
MTAYFISNAASAAFLTASFQCASVLTVTRPCTCKSEQARSETHKLKHTEQINQRIYNFIFIIQYSQQTGFKY